MFGLIDKDSLIVDVSDIQPTVSVGGTLFNNCFYQASFDLKVVENVPDFVKPQRFKVEADGVTFTALLVDLDPYEITLINASRDAEVVALKNNQKSIQEAITGLMDFAMM